MNHVGGDGFWLIREPSGRVRALMGAGGAGTKATRQLYREAGHHEIPSRGPLAALTVPGAVAGWMLAAEAAKAQVGKGLGGKLPLDVLLAPAIKHARDGYAVTRSQARRAGTPSSAPLPPRSTSWRRPGSTISIAAMSAVKSLPTWSASAARSRAPT